jgi:MoxR-like ATPase
MMCLSLGYPRRESEREILRRHRSGQPVDELQSVASAEQLLDIQKQVQQVKVEESISDYMLELADRTRNHPELTLGISTRGLLTLYRAAQSHAWVDGRNFVIPDDIKQTAVPVLAHRLVCRGVVTESRRDRASRILRTLLDAIPVPG